MIIGIDLGTTNSLVAYFSDDGPVLIPNALGEFLTPSAVFIDNKQAMSVGRSAKDRLVTDPESSTSKFKRLMGTHEAVRLGKRRFRPEDLSSFVLKSLKADAEAHLDMTITEAVISVPAYFNDIQRKATIAAAELAGLKVRRLINEPTAAALAYGLHDKEDENTFLVVDLGGGTFDVTILEMFSGVMEVRSSAGDAFLGGEDFTDRVFKEFLEILDVKPDAMPAADRARLRSVADKAKHMLTDQAIAEVTFLWQEEEKLLSISKSQFEAITDDLIKRMRLPIQRAIADANLKPDQINRIVLVGGATRMGLVRGLVTKLFKRFPEHSLDPDHVVALGAAVQAGLIARHAGLEEIVMTDVCPFTLGHETARQLDGRDGYEYGVFSPLIERNTTVPVSRAHRIVTLAPKQKYININVFQGEAPYVRDNIKIGNYTVEVPYNPKKCEAVDLRFTYDNSGVLEVIATVVATGKESKLIIESNPGVLSAKEIAERFKELERIKIAPRDEEVNRALIAKLSALYANALGARRQTISNLLSQFEAVLASYDKREIEDMRQHIREQMPYLDEHDVFE